MRLVLAALTRPLTVIVVMIAAAFCSVLAIQRMRVDIFPTVGEKAIYVAQPYSGMDPAQMEGFLNYYFEYHFLYITGIQYVESRNIQGASLMKLVFQPDTDMSDAMAQTVGYVNRARSFMPPGTVPPFITRFDAGSVPVGQLTFIGPNRTQAEIQNLALNRVRPVFATLAGVSAPPPFGGNQRTIVITLDPDKLREYSISPDEATAAVNQATLVMPSGNVRIGQLNLFATSNATLGGDLDALLSTPIRTVAGPTIFLRDIGNIEDSTDILTAYAHVDGRRTVYIPVTKRATASTLSVINEIKAAIPDLKKLVPPDINIRLDFDQSPYVSNSLNGLLFEAGLGAVLTGLMVLLFLRDWRSSVIVVINIPFAILTAVVLLWAARQTINVMTLGGLALAVGVLVDESTVEIENLQTHMASGVPRCASWKGHSANRARASESRKPAARSECSPSGRSARTGRNAARLENRSADCDRDHLSPPRSELSIFPPLVSGYFDHTGRVMRRAAHAADYANNTERPVVHRGDHGDRDCYCKLDPVAVVR